jgi:hypothetical protein
MRTCPICGYRLDDYELDAVTCGACLESYTEEAAAQGDPEAKELLRERGVDDQHTLIPETR